MRAAHAPLAVAVTASAAALCVAAYYAWRRRRQHCLSREVCERFGLSPTHGFITAAQTAPLPEKFAAWEAVASHLADLNRRGRLRAAVEGMPVLRVGPTELSEPALLRARVILCCLAHSQRRRHSWLFWQRRKWRRRRWRGRG